MLSLSRPGSLWPDFDFKLATRDGEHVTHNREKFSEALNAHESKMLAKFAEIGKEVNAEQQENLVRGALLSNVAQGKDKATASLKMLGSDQRVNMFQPESAFGSDHYPGRTDPAV